MRRSSVLSVCAVLIFGLGLGPTGAAAGGECADFEQACQPSADKCKAAVKPVKETCRRESIKENLERKPKGLPAVKDEWMYDCYARIGCATRRLDAIDGVLLTVHFLDYIYARTVSFTLTQGHSF